MLADAIKEITLLCDGARAPKNPLQVTIPGIPHKTLLVCGNGDREWYDHPPSERDHVVRDIESLVILADPHSSIWHDESGITLLIVDEQRRDRVHMPLTFTSQWIALQALSQPLAQREFIQALRVALRMEIESASPGLLHRLRTVKFRTDSDADGSIQHGRESMGRKVEAQLSGAEDLPDEFDLTVQLYDELDFHASVHCFLRVHLEEQKFSLAIASGDTTRELRAAQQHIRETLAELVECSVFWGQP